MSSLSPELIPDSSKKTPPSCPREGCPSRVGNRESGRVVRFGRFRRKCDGSRILRFRCLRCRRTFSSATFKPEFGQHKRRINSSVMRLLDSGVSQRRCARLLQVQRKTIVRKFRFMATQARIQHRQWIQDWLKGGRPLVEEVQMDELESFEHTKCKPLSIGILVEPKSRKILGLTVSSMPAKGLLVEKARKKYGPRKDERIQGLRHLLEDAQSCLHPRSLEIRSDSHPFYPGIIRSLLPQANHIREIGRKSSLGGQGELKKIGFDPLFSLNHTAAMIRANVNRMFRKTWCTTKKLEALQDHLWLYTVFHNTVLT
jgi:transposase-like protein